MKEEKIASVLVGEYEISIEEEMFIRAIKTQQMYFLYCLFAYNKNYYEIHEEFDSDVKLRHSLAGVFIRNLDFSGKTNNFI